MAVTRKDATRQLKMKVVAGTDETGKAIYATRNFSYIDPGSTDANCMAMGVALGGLQMAALSQISIVDNVVLVDE